MKKPRKRYEKSYNNRLKIHANKTPKVLKKVHDSIQCLQYQLRSIKEYKPKYILADKTYDTKKNKKDYNQRNNSNTTNEETPKNRKIQNKI